MSRWSGSSRLFHEGEMKERDAKEALNRLEAEHKRSKKPKDEEDYSYESEKALLEDKLEDALRKQEERLQDDSEEED